ncbi:hypothetical protein PR202_gb21658 [Eleusine coracana subsp. coracana]|uniref:Uncharacterized protein n=1 Tax=Eleusine coracana subsp. coracana TaxID=191504 RepID=A0AAV5FE57_ELECO|nr:hypothetical protein PR202_gb21658 [Eleusine coracana subsp. coracana]
MGVVRLLYLDSLVAHRIGAAAAADVNIRGAGAARHAAPPRRGHQQRRGLAGSPARVAVAAPPPTPHSTRPVLTRCPPTTARGPVLSQDDLALVVATDVVKGYTFGCLQRATGTAALPQGLLSFLAQNKDTCRCIGARLAYCSSSLHGGSVIRAPDSSLSTRAVMIPRARQINDPAWRWRDDDGGRRQHAAARIIDGTGSSDFRHLDIRSTSVKINRPCESDGRGCGVPCTLKLDHGSRRRLGRHLQLGPHAESETRQKQLTANRREFGQAKQLRKLIFIPFFKNPNATLRSSKN